MPAGAFIAMAADVIYMDPTGEIGAAEPRPPDPKAVSYAAARMRALASAKWNDSRVEVAESFVRENKALTGREAVGLELAQPPPPQGWTPVAEYRLDPLGRLLNAVSDPAVLFLMLLVGAALLGYEILTSGFQGVGVVGAVLIVAALYLLGQLGVEWLAVALALGGASLVIAEAAGHGLFATAGLALYGLSLYLAAASQPYYQWSDWAYGLAGLGAAAAVALAYLGYKVRQSVRRRVQSYAESLKGALGVAKTAISPGRPGVVYAAGEEWTAVSDEFIPGGSKVVVTDVEGLTVKVKKA